ncbi:MAG: AAA family ATPase, partial [Trichodesmium sp. St11_bin5]|nr:AAA family ATPase [Trichodesmium sp. St11_bin5]
MNFQAEFELLLRSRYSIIYVQTREEERVEKTIAELAKKQGNRAVYIWDFVEGYENNPNDIGWGKRNPLQGLELV